MTRFSYLNRVVFGILSLTGYAAGNSVNSSTNDILASVYGPIDTWHAIRAIDVYPDGIFDGQPVTESLIFAYEPPSSASQEQHDLASSLLREKGL